MLLSDLVLPVSPGLFQARRGYPHDLPSSQSHSWGLCLGGGSWPLGEDPLPSDCHTSALWGLGGCTSQAGCPLAFRKIIRARCFSPGSAVPLKEVARPSWLLAPNLSLELDLGMEAHRVASGAAGVRVGG